MTSGERTAPAPGREILIQSILAFLPGQDAPTSRAIRAALAAEIDRAGDAGLRQLRDRLASDHGWTYYPPDPLAQRIHYVLAERFLDRGSRLEGQEHLAAIVSAPAIVFANHLSYADANVIEVLLQRAGATTLANRLTAIAGPKVFTSRERRFSSLCFGTIKVPQSADVSSGEAVLNARAVAQAARQAIASAQQRLAEGDALLLFGEGTRSRSASMQPMLAAVARYLDNADALIVPAGLEGTEALFSIERAELRPARVSLTIGRPFPASALVAHAGRDRRVVMDAIGLAIAELVPAGYRGVYADAAGFAAAGRALLAARRV